MAASIAGRYEVVRLLGQGSSGRTMLCDDRREGRQVAIKELRFEQLDDPSGPANAGARRGEEVTLF